LEKSGWFEGPQWLIDAEKWPEQPKIEQNKSMSEEQKLFVESVFQVREENPDEFDLLLSRSSY
jgi:hypothetical protein